MKVAEMEGALLDYWVARAEGYDHGLNIEANFGLCKAPAMPDDVQLQGIGSGTSDIFSPSRYWEQGGPIIEREGIKLLPPQADRSRWLAEVFQGKPHFGWSEADTPLVAAMRAYVASRFGDDVVMQ